MMDSQKKKKREKFFWREFWPFAEISRRENNPVYGNLSMMMMTDNTIHVPSLKGCNSDR